MDKTTRKKMKRKLIKMQNIMGKKKGRQAWREQGFAK